MLHTTNTFQKKVAYRLQFVSVHVAVVAVLQFQNRLYGSQKLTLYLYINIEVFLGYGNSFSRTATLQRCNSFCQDIQERKKIAEK